MASVQRLIIQFHIPNPARHYISGELSLHGLPLTEPVGPETLGVRNFQDISPDPVSSDPRYYANLAARYQVEDIAPP